MLESLHLGHDPLAGLDVGIQATLTFHAQMSKNVVRECNASMQSNESPYKVRMMCERVGNHPAMNGKSVRRRWSFPCLITCLSTLGTYTYYLTSWHLRDGPRCQDINQQA